MSFSVQNRAENIIQNICSSKPNFKITKTHIETKVKNSISKPKINYKTQQLKFKDIGRPV